MYNIWPIYKPFAKWYYLTGVLLVATDPVFSVTL